MAEVVSNFPWDACGTSRKNEQLHSPPIGLRKISIDYFFFQADQWDCTKIFIDFQSICFLWTFRNVPNLLLVSFPLNGLDALLTSEILRDAGKSQEAT